MKKILLASAFALIGTFAMANETKLSGFEIKIETVEVDGLLCCTAMVTYNGIFKKSFTECSGTTAINCGLVTVYAQNFISQNGGGTVQPAYSHISEHENEN